MDLMKLSTFILALSVVHSCGDQNRWSIFDRKNKNTRNDSLPAAPEVTQNDLPNDPIYKAALTNTDYLIASVNLKQLLDLGYHGRSLTIAILDNGYGGLSNSRGKNLPPDIKVEEFPVKNESPTPHGTKLAEIIFAMTSGSPRWSPTSQHPTIKLYNSNGFSNFSAAVDRAITDKVDMIVYSQVWEYGGNFDGRGFINAVVDRATSAGVLWINAAGNYATSAWQGGVEANEDQTLKLPFQNKYIRLVVNNPSTKVKISLSWNDFSDQKDWKTTRDLNLRLFSLQGKQLAESTKTQDGITHTEEEIRTGNFSSHAREVIETVLQPGIYLIRADMISKNFDADSRARIAADGVNISFIDQATDASVMIPADNSNVLTIGASDDYASSFGRTIAGAHKPEVTAPSIIEFESNASFIGTSSAAAITAATLAVYQEACGKHNRNQIISKINSGDLSQLSTSGRGLWIKSSHCH